jgi:hypothetical protein
VKDPGARSASSCTESPSDFGVEGCREPLAKCRLVVLGDVQRGKGCERSWTQVGSDVETPTLALQAPGHGERLQAVSVVENAAPAFKRKGRKRLRPQSLEQPGFVALSKRLEFEIKRALQSVEVALRSKPLAERRLSEPLEFNKGRKVGLAAPERTPRFRRPRPTIPPHVPCP